MRLLGLALRYTVRPFFESLPNGDREAGVFLSGMCWAFAIFWLLVFLMSWLVLGGTR